MGNPEMMSKAIKARLEAEKSVMTKLNTLGKNVQEKEIRSEVVAQSEIDPAVEELVVNALKHAKQKHLSLVEWTKEIIEGAKMMKKNQQEQVIELTAKVTASQGIPTFDQPTVPGEGQVEVA